MHVSHLDICHHLLHNYIYNLHSLIPPFIEVEDSKSGILYFSKRKERSYSITSEDFIKGDPMKDRKKYSLGNSLVKV